MNAHAIRASYLDAARSTIPLGRHQGGDDVVCVPDDAAHGLAFGRDLASLAAGYRGNLRVGGTRGLGQPDGQIVRQVAAPYGVFRAAGRFPPPGSLITLSSCGPEQTTAACGIENLGLMFMFTSPLELP